MKNLTPIGVRFCFAVYSFSLGGFNGLTELLNRWFSSLINSPVDLIHPVQFL